MAKRTAVLHQPAKSTRAAAAMHPLKKKKKRVLAGKSLGVAPPVFGRGGRRRVPPARKKTPPPPPPPPPPKPIPPVPPPPPTNETWDQKALREWQLEKAINEGGAVARDALLNYQFSEEDIRFAKQFVKEKIEPLIEE